MKQPTIYEVVREAEQNYISGTTVRISKYVEFDQYENINRIDAYLNSQHISGPEDALGREKPFFNIVTAAVNIWYRATQIKKELIKIRPDKATNVLSTFLANVHLQYWMKKSGFGIYLENWGLTLARFGSAVTKFVEKDGELHIINVPWNRLICDQVDFENNPKIEKLYFTPAQLRKNKSYDQDMVENLIEARTSRENLNGQKIDAINDYIEIYEVHGEMPLSYLTGDGDDDQEYVQQMHIISFYDTKVNGEFDEYTLYSGREKKDPYVISHLLKTDGRTQSIGAVEYLFDAQWMVNHSVKLIKDQLDLASKLIFQTADNNYVGRNALDSIEQGDIMVHEENMPITQIQNNSHDVTSLQNYSTAWQQAAQSISGTPDALRGESPNAGTAYRLQQLVTNEAHSLFDEMRDNKDLAIECMMREFILPYIKKKIDTVDEISATLDSYQIKQIDSIFVPNEAIKRNNQKAIDEILKGNIYTPQMQQADTANEAQSIQSGLDKLGNKRFIKPSDIDGQKWSDILADWEWEVEVDTPSSQKNLDLMLTTITNLLQTIANPMTAGVMNTPQGKFLFNKILELSATVSPLELSDMSSQPMPTPAPQPIAGGAPVPSPVPGAAGGAPQPIGGSY